MTIETIYQSYLKSTVVCTDTRQITKGCLFFALKGDNFDGNTFAQNAIEKGAAFCVIDDVTLGYNTEQFLLVDDVLQTLQALARYHRKQLQIPVIALTGSNGKTTTKELIDAVLSQKFKTIATKGNLNNHIGVPLTLLSMNNATEIGIVEMGANHQKEIEFLCNIAYPDYGLITNFGKAHLEGFGGIEGVIKGKSEMYAHLKEHDKIIFVNETDIMQVKQAGDYNKIVLFGKSMVLEKSHPYLNVSFGSTTFQTHLTGSYNFNNICVAIAIGQYFKISEVQISEAIANYIPTNNRSQLIQKNGLHIVLDAYNANPTSMEAALKSFVAQNSSPKFAILGDMFELGKDAIKEHQAIVDLVLQLPIDQIILVGKLFFQTTTDSKKILYFENFEDLKTDLKALNFNKGKLLVKGSRGMALERVLDLI